MTAHRMLAAFAVLAAFAWHASWFAAAHAQTVCPPSCANQVLTTPNFSHQDLTNADFQGATLVGAAFFRATLTGAKFDKATFSAAAGNPTQVTDFTFADLTNATFTGATFQAPTYFTYATLTCTDFSQTDLAAGNMVFGDDPLIYTQEAGCKTPSGRTSFAGATMNCEFIDDWRNFDLTGANVSACLGQLAGRNFAGAVLASVNLTGAILDGATFTGANLIQATLNGASLQCAQAPGGGTQTCVDLSNAMLQGAKLNNANLTGASLYKAFLSNDLNGNISEAASLQQAHLKNVNLAFAQLSGVDFTLANFYGNVPANPSGCGTTQPDNAGFTNGCASAHGATMTGTTFVDAYLYGVDFSNAAISGVDFTDAVLVGANFSAAAIGTYPGTGAVTKFERTYLQGTNLDTAKSLVNADLTDAFVDFRNQGNILYIDLDGTDHNTFACSTPSTCNPAQGEDVCVWVRYSVATTVPGGNSTITCPDGSSGGSGCGAADPSGGNAHWKSRLVIGTPPNPGPPAGWYTDASTYTPAAPASTVCNGKGTSARIIEW